MRSRPEVTSCSQKSSGCFTESVVDMRRSESKHNLKTLKLEVPAASVEYGTVFEKLAETVAAQLRAAWLGEIVDSQRIGDHDVDILVRQAAEEARNDPRMILGITDRVPVNADVQTMLQIDVGERERPAIELVAVYLAFLRRAAEVGIF